MSVRKLMGLTMTLFAVYAYGQETHIMERSLIEVSYHVIENYIDKFGLGYDDYALRIGKTKSQYFSLHQMRDDSIGSDKRTAMILINEMLDAARNRNDKSKQRPKSPGHGDYLYRDLSNDTIKIYSSIMSSSYRITDCPTFNWKIYDDSTKFLLHYKCHLATTNFRGRLWKVWYAEDIPIPLGPWKFFGLPGLILEAECSGYITIQAVEIKTKNLSPITFYNFWDKKFEYIDRIKFQKAKNDPRSYPKGTFFYPPMELE